MKRFAYGFLTVVAVACGGSTTTTGTDASTTNDGGTTNDGSTALDANFGDAGTFCGAKKQHDEGCGSAFDQTACLKLEACVSSVMRPENVASYETCLVTRTCGTSDDKCIAAEEAKYLNDTATNEFRKNCFARRTACLEAGTSFADDSCGVFGVFKDSFRASWADCLTKPCDQISQCFSNLSKGQNCN